MYETQHSLSLDGRILSVSHTNPIRTQKRNSDSFDTHLQIRLCNNLQQALISSINELDQCIDKLHFQKLTDQTNGVQYPIEVVRIYDSDQEWELFLNPSGLQTDLKFPNTSLLLSNLSDNLIQASILRLPAKTKIPWHSHLGRNLNIVLAPIRTNSFVLNKVAISTDCKKRPQIYQQHYGKNEIWLFNSENPHSVENRGDSDRYCLQIYIPRNDEKFRKLLGAV